MPVDDELVDGQQLDRRHTEGQEVIEHLVVDEPEVGPPHPLGDLRVPHRHPLDVALVDERATLYAKIASLHRIRPLIAFA
jgi:hypothetical protein